MDFISKEKNVFVSQYHVSSSVECHSSCLTCLNKDSCESCVQTISFLDEGTHLCTICLANEYALNDRCEQCSEGCSCKFKEECFDCPEFYDLESEKCESTCDGIEILRNGAKFCRIKNKEGVYEYYVDPLSPSPIELGTKVHPFKQLKLATTEIHN